MLNEGRQLCPTCGKWLFKSGKVSILDHKNDIGNGPCKGIPKKKPYFEQDATDFLLERIENKGFTFSEIMQYYINSLSFNEETDYRLIHIAIIKRWGGQGLRRIKERAEMLNIL